MVGARVERIGVEEASTMRTIIIDITEFDQDEQSKETRVVYGFRRKHLDNPSQTIQDFVANPSAFRDGEYKAILTEGQNARFVTYLRAGNYRCADFSKDDNPDYLLAFSYGENPDVNMQLATIVQRGLQDTVSLRAIVQWEIANILYERDRRLRGTVQRIDLDYERDYITSAEVLEKFKRFTKREMDPKVFVVCQAWHAPCCIQICAKEGLKVVRGEFIDDFSRSDPQKWVRNWLAWVLKEGTRK